MDLYGHARSTDAHVDIMDSASKQKVMDWLADSSDEEGTTSATPDAASRGRVLDHLALGSPAPSEAAPAGAADARRRGRPPSRRRRNRRPHRRRRQRPQRGARGRARRWRRRPRPVAPAPEPPRPATPPAPAPVPAATPPPAGAGRRPLARGGRTTPPAPAVVSPTATPAAPAPAPAAPPAIDFLSSVSAAPAPRGAGPQAPTCSRWSRRRRPLADVDLLLDGADGTGGRRRPPIDGTGAGRSADGERGPPLRWSRRPAAAGRGAPKRRRRRPCWRRSTSSSPRHRPRRPPREPAATVDAGADGARGARVLQPTPLGAGREHEGAHARRRASE